MDNNIVSVKLDSRYASTLGVWQYDYGQVLRITGPELPPAVEVQFSLDELKKSCYIQKCLKRRIDCMQSGRIDIPKETVDEIRKNMPQVKATGGIKIADGMVEESEIKNGVELYNKIKKTFII